MTDRLAAALREAPRSLHAPWVLSRQWRGETTHLSKGVVRYAVGKVERAAGLRDAKDGQCHRLRHTFVTRLASANVQV